jgi:RND family efflux transporter MFP subunit
MENTMNIEKKQFPYPRLLSALVCGLLFLGGCQQEAKHQASSPPPLPLVDVQVLTVAESETVSQNEVVGTLEAVQRATIAAKVTGTIAEMPVTLGAMVKQGDLLVKVNAAEISARLSQAETGVAQAKRNLDREQRLFAKNASTSETVNAQQDALKLAQAALSEARTMLGYITIRAPFSGRVSAKPANAGDLATAGSPLLMLENTDTLQAVAAVPEAQFQGIKPGDSLPVRVPAAKIDTIGLVAEIAPTADAASRTALVKMDLAPNPALRPGQFVRVIFPGATTKSLMVPTTALSLFGQMERVFVVADNQAHLRLVRSGMQRDGKIEIVSGLSPGEQVVVRGEGQLVDGQPVRVTP